MFSFCKDKQTFGNIKERGRKKGANNSIVTPSVSLRLCVHCFLFLKKSKNEFGDEVIK
jgi:hypothetical protein